MERTWAWGSGFANMFLSVSMAAVAAVGGRQVDYSLHSIARGVWVLGCRTICRDGGCTAGLDCAD